MKLWLPKRRWLRFSLRSLLLLMTVIALVSARWVNRARDQQATIALLKARFPKCSLQYDYEYERFQLAPASMVGRGFSLPSGTPAPSEPEVWAPDWLRRRLGPDFFFGLASVSIPWSSAPLDPEIRKALGRLTSLRDLRVGCPVSDDDVMALTRRAPLRALGLSCGGPLTDKSLHAIAGLRELESLTLCSANFSAEGLRQLAQLKQLQSLHLPRRGPFGSSDAELGFTDEQIAAISRCDNVTFLYLSSRCVTDAGLAELRNLHRLRDLHLTAALPTGEGFGQFGARTQLEFLAIKMPQANWVTLATHLRTIPSLKRLVVYSDTCNLAELRQALPGVKVSVAPAANVTD